MNLIQFLVGRCTPVIFVISLVLICMIKSTSAARQRRQVECRPPDFPLKYMASKAPYIFSDKDFVNVTYIPKSGCEAKQIWMLLRHGTRLPGKDDIKSMLKNLPNLREQILNNHDTNGDGKLCKVVVDELKAWVLNITVLNTTLNSQLVDQGYKEHFGIASRYQQRFPNLLKKQYSNETFKFKFTKTQRAEESAKSFNKALFGEDGSSKVWYPEPLYADPLIRFYKNCSKWQKEVDDNPDRNIETDKFVKSQPFQSMLSTVAARLGMKNLSFELAETMYLACSFETAWNGGKLAPWCGVFSEDDMVIWEYWEDLIRWWQDGYAYEITYKQACPPVKDMVDQFSNQIYDPDTKHKVTAYFAHSGTNCKVLSRLGLFNDSVELLASNYEQLKVNRTWVSGVMDTFANNIAFVLYSCPTSPQYQVGAFFQEKPISIPACNGNWTCPFDTFKLNLKEIVDNCDLEKICSVDDGASSLVSSISILITALTTTKLILY